MTIPPNDPVPADMDHLIDEIPDTVDYQAVVDILRNAYPDMHVEEIVAHVTRILKEQGV